MPIETKEVLEFLGYKPEDFKELADLKTKFDAEFIRTSAITEDSEPVKKILGKTFGTLENEIKKVAKGFDIVIDFEGADYQANKKVADKFKFVLNTHNEASKLIIDDLTAKAGLGNDEKIKDLTTKIEKHQQKTKDLQALLDSTKGEYETFKTTKETEIKNTKLNVHKSEIFSKAKFIPDTNDFTKKGFLDTFQEKYKIDLDENDKPVIMDKAGNRLISTKVSGTHKTVDEVLEEELINAKLFPSNPKAGQPIIKTPFQQQQIQGDQTKKRKAVQPL